MRFDRHYAGSLPCMPARHDLLCGALDFLWKPWGSIELWEEPITVALRRARASRRMLVSDHPHLFEIGGENYHCDFSGVGLPARPRERPVAHAPGPELGRRAVVRPRPHALRRLARLLPRRGRLPRARARWRAAARWLERDAPHHERFLLFVDEFDPHEPFDTPEPYASHVRPGRGRART